MTGESGVVEFWYTNISCVYPLLWLGVVYKGEDSSLFELMMKSPLLKSKKSKLVGVKTQVEDLLTEGARESVTESRSHISRKDHGAE